MHPGEAVVRRSSLQHEWELQAPGKGARGGRSVSSFLKWVLISTSTESRTVVVALVLPFVHIFMTMSRMVGSTGGSESQDQVLDTFLGILRIPRILSAQRLYIRPDSLLLATWQLLATTESMPMSWVWCTPLLFACSLIHRSRLIVNRKSRAATEAGGSERLTSPSRTEKLIKSSKGPLRVLSQPFLNWNGKD